MINAITIIALFLAGALLITYIQLLLSSAFNIDVPNNH